MSLPTLPLPWPDFKRSARELRSEEVLYAGRLCQWTWQRIEKGDFQFHVKPWVQTPTSILVYGIYLYAELHERGDYPGDWGARKWFEERRAEVLAARPPFKRMVPMPAWWGDEEMHSYYRQLLCWHNPIYLNVWPEEPEPYDEPEAPWVA